MPERPYGLKCPPGKACEKSQEPVRKQAMLLITVEMSSWNLSLIPSHNLLGNVILSVSVCLISRKVLKTIWAMKNFLCSSHKVCLDILLMDLAEIL